MEAEDNISKTTKAIQGVDDTLCDIQASLECSGGGISDIADAINNLVQAVNSVADALNKKG